MLKPGARNAEPAVFLLPGEQTALAQYLFAEFAFQAVAQQESGVGCVADAKLRNGLFVQPAAKQVLPRSRSFGTLQAFLKKRHGPLMNVQQLGAQPGFLGLRGTRIARLGQRDTEFLRHEPDCLRERNVLGFLHETEDVPRNSAAKAVIKLARRMHGKRRGFLAVERA